MFMLTLLLKCNFEYFRQIRGVVMLQESFLLKLRCFSITNGWN